MSEGKRVHPDSCLRYPMTQPPAEPEREDCLRVCKQHSVEFYRGECDICDLRRQLAGLKDEIRVIRDRLVGPGGVMDCVVAAERLLEKK